MAQGRQTARDPRVLMCEAEAWRETLADDPEATAPLLIAWTAWRWAEAAQGLIETGARQHQAIAVVTLLAHARILLDLLDSGRIETAVTVHARATHGAERLTPASLGRDAAFIQWRSGESLVAFDDARSRRWLAALRRRLSQGA